MNCGSLAIDIAFGGLIQVIVERLPEIGDIAFLHHDGGEVRASRHAAAACFGLLQRDIEAQFPQPGDQPDVAVATGGLLVQHPLAELAHGRAVVPIRKYPSRCAE